MMKNIVKSLVVIIAAAAIVGGATYAVFSDSETIEDNTISTATVELSLISKTSGQIDKPIDVDDLLPGEYTDWARVGLYNQSSVAVKSYMYVENVTGDACDKTNLEVWTGHALSSYSDDERDRKVYEGSLAGLTDAGNRVELTGTPPFSEIPANWTQIVHQRAELDASADDSYQNTSCEWDEVFVIEAGESDVD